VLIRAFLDWQGTPRRSASRTLAVAATARANNSVEKVGLPENREISFQSLASAEHIDSSNYATRFNPVCSAQQSSPDGVFQQNC
jgi:hypothetical protein